jgi:hypothetical protein
VPSGTVASAASAAATTAKMPAGPDVSYLTFVRK